MLRSQRIPVVLTVVLLLNSTFFGSGNFGNPLPDAFAEDLSALTNEQLVSELESDLSALENLGNIIDEAVVVDITNETVTDLTDEVRVRVDDGELKPNLLNILNTIPNEIAQARNFVLATDESGVTNMLNSTANKLSAFISQVEAERGKKISDQLADELIGDAQSIIDNTTLRGNLVATLLSEESTLTITSEAFDLIEVKVQEITDIRIELENRGFVVESDAIQQSPLQGIMRIHGPLEAVEIVGTATCAAMTTTALFQFSPEFLFTNEQKIRMFLVTNQLCEDVAVTVISMPEILEQAREFYKAVIEFLLGRGSAVDIATALNQPAIRDIWLESAQSLDALTSGLANFVGLVTTIIGNSLAGIISGIKFNDIDGDGTQELANGEGGVSGVTIFAENSINGEIVQDITDFNGQYQLSNLATGTYTVLEVVQEGWAQTTPDPLPPTNGAHFIDIEAGSTFENIDFGNRIIAPEIVTLTVSEDSYTHGFDPLFEPLNFNGQGLITKFHHPQFGSQDNRKTWLKFELPVIPQQATQATMRLYVTGFEFSGSGIEVHRHDNDNWSENTITFLNEPARFADLSAGPFASATFTQVNQYYDIDVTQALTASPGDQTITLVLVGTTLNNGVGFADGESANPPQLVLELSSPIPVPTGGLVAEWLFEDNTLDTSNNNNDGTLNGATFVDGIVGRALSFDGINDFVSVPDNPSLKGMAELTVSAWFNLDSDAITSSPYILTKQESAFTNLGGYEVLIASNDARALFDIGGSVKDISTSGINYRDGLWHHVAATYDGSAMRLYVDGVIQSSIPASGSIGTSTIPLTIGVRNDSTLFFDGFIDQVRVYNRALSASEVQALFNE